MAYTGDTIYDYSDYAIAFSTDGSLGYAAMAYPEYRFYQEGTVHDAHLYYRNDSGLTLRHVKVTPYKKGSAHAVDDSQWFQLAFSQAALAAAARGGALVLGETFAPLATQDFWLRATSPADQAAGSYTDVVLRVTGYVDGRYFSTFTMDTIIS